MVKMTKTRRQMLAISKKKTKRMKRLILGMENTSLPSNF
jgi:hypothetical protein